MIKTLSGCFAALILATCVTLPAQASLLLFNGTFSDGDADLSNDPGALVDASGIDCALARPGLNKCEYRNGQLRVRTYRTNTPNPHPDAFFSFGFSALGGLLDLESISFNHRWDGINRDSAFDIYLGATALAINESVGANKTWKTFVGDLTGFAPAPSVEFRVFLRDVSNGDGLNGQMMLDNLQLRGTVASVSSPSVLALMVAGGALLGWRRRR